MKMYNEIEGKAFNMRAVYDLPDATTIISNKNMKLPVQIVDQRDIVVENNQLEWRILKPANGNDIKWLSLRQKIHSRI